MKISNLILDKECFIWNEEERDNDRNMYLSKLYRKYSWGLVKMECEKKLGRSFLNGFFNWRFLEV